MFNRPVARAFAVVAGILLGLTVVFTQTPAQPPGIPEALRLQQKDPAGAAKILEGVTEREPKNARVWRLLGIARQQAKDYDGAIKAYTAALDLGPDATATYNLGTAFARKGDLDKAFEWLSKAKAARFDMSTMEIDTDLVEVRKDPRYASVAPKPEDFANPFVEKTKIVGEWKGEASNDVFGWIARAIGDVDGDKASDFVVSAPGHASIAPNAGRIYVYSSKSARLLWKADGAQGDRMGTSLEAAGDVNKDGTPDVVASAGRRVKVFSGKDGSLLHALASPTAVGLTSAAGAGDVNGDGHADILAGSAPRPSPPGAPAQSAPPGPGAAYVFSGKDAAVLLTLAGERDGDGFGSAVAAGTRGRLTMLVVGAPGAGASRTGRTYVYTSLDPKPAFVIDSDETGTALGAMFVAVAGDVDGDGVADAYAADFANRAKGPSTGRVYVHSGKDGRRLLALTGNGPGEAFGTSPSNAGDINGDGHDDLAVGAWQHAGAAMSGGRIYMHSGKDGSLLGTITCRIPGDTLGFDSVGIGDVDGDGTVDLLVTSAYSGINGYRSGRVFIVSSGIRRGRVVDDRGEM